MIKELARLIKADLCFQDGESDFNIDSDIGEYHVLCSGKCFATFYIRWSTHLQPEESELLTITLIIADLHIAKGEDEVNMNITDEEIETELFIIMER